MLAGLPLLASLPLTGQITLGAPGLPVGQYFINTTPQSRSFNVGYYYRYDIHGFYGRTDVDRVPDTYVNSGGYMCSNGSFGRRRGSRVQGWARGAVSVNNYWYPRTLHLQTNRAHETSGDRVFTGPCIQLVNRNIYPSFHMSGNTLDPDGYLVMFGEVMKYPPRPSGSLSLPSYVVENEKVNIGYEIDRPTYDESWEIFDWDPSTWTIDSGPGL